MTTTDHLLAYASYGSSCSCGYSSTYAGLTRHLLDVGRDEGRLEGLREGYGMARHLLDEGYEFGLAAAKGEPVAADDPRIKPGARVRVEFDSPNGVTAHEGVVTGLTVNRSVRLVAAGWLVKGAARVYLLAEAPDPDAEVLEALAAAEDPDGLADLDSLTNADRILDNLRAAGYDVVKAVAK